MFLGWTEPVVGVIGDSLASWRREAGDVYLRKLVEIIHGASLNGCLPRMSWSRVSASECNLGVRLLLVRPLAQ